MSSVAPGPEGRRQPHLPAAASHTDAPGLFPVRRALPKIAVTLQSARPPTTLGWGEGRPEDASMSPAAAATTCGSEPALHQTPALWCRAGSTHSPPPPAGSAASATPPGLYQPLRYTCEGVSLFLNGLLNRHIFFQMPARATDLDLWCLSFLDVLWVWDMWRLSFEGRYAN